MKFLRIISYCGLALSILPAFLVYHGTIAKSTYLQLMLVGMVLWFSTAILWIKPDKLGD